MQGALKKVWTVRLADDPHCEWDKYKKNSLENLKNPREIKKKYEQSVKGEPNRRPSLWMRQI